MSQLYEGILDPGCNKTLIPSADWFESFKEVSINIGVAKKGACLTGTRQGVVHFVINGHRITIQDAIYSVDCTTTLFADVDILANNRNWEYKVDLSGAVFFDKKTRQVLFNANLAPSGLKMLQFEVVNRVFANAATIKFKSIVIDDKHQCESCVAGKFKLAKVGSESRWTVIKATGPGKMLHADVTGKFADGFYYNDALDTLYPGLNPLLLLDSLGVHKTSEVLSHCFELEQNLLALTACSRALGRSWYQSLLKPNTSPDQFRIRDYWHLSIFKKRDAVPNNSTNPSPAVKEFLRYFEFSSLASVI
ncbi:hypothetical protein BDR26DRAFT_952416 [Obelidium mucronatum]|nr:hypothetical protein BDR26DRAFT_952416 [Obelidium mucronatum]